MSQEDDFVSIAIIIHYARDMGAAFTLRNYGKIMAATISGKRYKISTGALYVRKIHNFAYGIYAISETMSKIIVQKTPITVLSVEEQDYISLTDMATAKEGDNRSADIIKNWLRNRYTIEFLGTWEVIHNPDFKMVEFDHFRMSAGLPSFVLSA